jgi:hypothetical protein
VQGRNHARFRVFYLEKEGRAVVTEREEEQRHCDRRSQICYLRDVEHLTFAAIGERLGISPQAAQQAYQRATRRGGCRKPPRKPHKYQ